MKPIENDINIGDILVSSDKNIIRYIKKIDYVWKYNLNQIDEKDKIFYIQFNINAREIINSSTFRRNVCYNEPAPKPANPYNILFTLIKRKNHNAIQS